MGRGVGVRRWGGGGARRGDGGRTEGVDSMRGCMKADEQMVRSAVVEELPVVGRLQYTISLFSCLRVSVRCFYVGRV